MNTSKHTSKKNLAATPGTKEFRDRYFDKQEVLQTFDISSRTLQTWRKINNVSFIRIGNKTYYLKESFNNLFPGNTVFNNIENGQSSDINEATSIEKNNVFSADTIKPQLADIQQPKSFAKVWDPIPGYMTPMLVMAIYFTPYIKDIINGNSIDSFYLLLPLMVGGLGCATYFLLQVSIGISNKITRRRKTF